jgi:mannobiose 2-epimerase
MAHELTTGILPFWQAHAFDANGRLVGAVDDDGTHHDEGPRSAVLVARIVWTFAAAAQALPDQRESLLATGRQALEWLTGPLWDHKYGGVYWAVDGDGEVLDDRKQVYAQAFAIYALAQWHLTTGDEDVLGRAVGLFLTLEEHARDFEHGGYVEARSRDWGRLDNMALSPKDLNVPKSMNTNLHVMEAFETLARAHPGAVEALGDVVRVCATRIVRHEPWTHCGLFFDEQWNVVGDTISYGHDIEASWLLWQSWETWESLTTTPDAGLAASVRQAMTGLADAVIAHGVDRDGAVMYEGGPEGVRNVQKHWWPQAEGVVGWINALQLTGDSRYVDAALAAWDFVEESVIDRKHGEWFAELERDGSPRVGTEGEVKIGPWKCPYHNARACLEIMARLK